MKPEQIDQIFDTWEAGKTPYETLLALARALNDENDPRRERREAVHSELMGCAWGIGVAMDLMAGPEMPSYDRRGGTVPRTSYIYKLRKAVGYSVP
jgi:hypothetical protein